MLSVVDKMQRHGLRLPQPRRPTVVLAGTPVEIENAYAAVDTTLRARPGFRLVIAALPPDLPTLRERYLHETVLPLPFASARARWMHALDMRLVVAAEENGLPDRDPAVVAIGSDRLGDAIREALPDVGFRPAATPARLIDRLSGPHIASLDELRIRLGAPRTILCLGNGPSSEDPALAAHAGAALFRVNWTWRARGVHAAPDVVFTADPDLPPRGRRPILAFPTTIAGRAILRRHALMLRPSRSGHLFLDALEPPLADLSGPVLPTNGALMLAVAAALRPERLVVAGIDLYRHPEGRYPGADAAVDGYGREHSAAVDLALMRQTLATFAGEVVHVGAALAAALDSDG